METYINDEGMVNDELKNIEGLQQGSEEPAGPDHPNRNKIHSSAMYAASKWHSSVKHARPSHNGDSLLPLQA